jgi:hypothetical protein
MTTIVEKIDSLRNDMRVEQRLYQNDREQLEILRELAVLVESKTNPVTEQKSYAGRGLPKLPDGYYWALPTADGGVLCIAKHDHGNLWRCITSEVNRDLHAALVEEFDSRNRG